MSEDDPATSTTVTSPGPPGQERPLLIGATAADPRNVVVIWNAMRRWLTEHGMPVEYALFSTYDAMGRALLDGMIDVAWNAPMAHAQSLMTSGGACRTLAMRDTDQDVAAVIIALTSSGITSVEDLRGRTLAVGVANSTELRLIPAHQLRAQGFDLETDCTHAEIEPRPAANGIRWVDGFLIFEAIRDGRADAGVIFEPMLDHLVRKRGLDSDDITVVWRSEPFCHCAFTARPDLPAAVSTRFVELLTAMDPDDPSIAEMMRLEHLTRWLPATDDGWSGVIDAIRAANLEGATFV
ncbi:MAG: phosphate/phosphite/phosphonate ABC transporter substrate-binding protein [Actinomycetota bacterium]|nr:phosphate/phosphite/phosphonate ABC transporter substrate-binding protein [Actinomycetota bacterium]